MLKEDIVKALKGTSPEEQHREAIAHAADAIVEIQIRAMAESIGKAIAVYDDYREGEPSKYSGIG